MKSRSPGNRQRLHGISAEIERSSFDPHKSGMLERARAEIEAAVRDIAEKTTQTTERLKYANEKIAEYRRTEAQVRDLQKQSADIREEIELLKLTRTVIADYVVYLMQVVRSRLEGEVSRIISEITGGRYEQVLLDEDFNLLVRDIDDDYTIDRFSGGEQDDIAVALRIALSRYLAELHNVHESTILIFDEIFGSQDEERRNNLLTTLRTQESRFPQIILISHISEMQGEFSNTLVVEMGTDMVEPGTGGGGLNESCDDRYEESVDRALRRIADHVPEDLVRKVCTGERDHKRRYPPDSRRSLQAS